MIPAKYLGEFASRIIALHENEALKNLYPGISDKEGFDSFFWYCCNTIAPIIIFYDDDLDERKFIEVVAKEVGRHLRLDKEEGKNKPDTDAHAFVCQVALMGESVLHSFEKRVQKVFIDQYQQDKHNLHDMDRVRDLEIEGLHKTLFYEKLRDNAHHYPRYRNVTEEIIRELNGGEASLSFEKVLNLIDSKIGNPDNAEFYRHIAKDCFREAMLQENIVLAAGENEGLDKFIQLLRNKDSLEYFLHNEGYDMDVMFFTKIEMVQMMTGIADALESERRESYMHKEIPQLLPAGLRAADVSEDYAVEQMENMALHYIHHCFQEAAASPLMRHTAREENREKGKEPDRDNGLDI